MKSEWDFIAKYISELDTSSEESEEECAAEIIRLNSDSSAHSQNLWPKKIFDFPNLICMSSMMLVLVEKIFRGTPCLPSWLE